MKLISINKKDRRLEAFSRKEWQKFDRSIGYKRKERKFTFIAQNKREILGLIKFSIDGGAAYLSQLLVKDTQRGEGIGSLLIKKFENIAKKEKCHIAYLKTSENHKGALSFYKNQGYKIISTLKNNICHLDWFYLAKELK